MNFNQSDFIYIDDVARAVVLAAKKVSGSEILNVCTGQDVSIRKRGLFC